MSRGEPFPKNILWELIKKCSCKELIIIIGCLLHNRLKKTYITAQLLILGVGSVASSMEGVTNRISKSCVEKLGTAMIASCDYNNQQQWYQQTMMATAVNDTASTLNQEGNQHSNNSREMMVTIKYVKQGSQINQLRWPQQ